MAKYTIEQKLEVITHFQENGLTSTVKKYNVSTTAIYCWLNKYERGNIMRKQTQYYTVEEKLEIINYYKKFGVRATEKKYNIANSIFYKWERILLEQGKTALAYDNRGRKPRNVNKQNVNDNPDLLKEVQRLRLENAYLKKLKALREEEQKLK